MLKPKKLSASDRIKNAKKAITKPIIAAMIVPRALSTFALSPPDVIQRMPPQIKKKRAIRTAIIRMKVTAAPTMGPILFAFRLQSLLNCPALGHGLTFFPVAKAEAAKLRYDPTVINIATSFFISIPS